MCKTLSETFWPSSLFTFTTLTAVHVHQFLNLISAKNVLSCVLCILIERFIKISAAFITKFSLFSGYHTANSTVSRRVSPCTSCRWNRFTQQKRPFFGIFKKTPEPEPVREEDLAYRVVTPRNVSARRTVPDSIKKPEYAVTGKAGTIRPYPVVLNRDEADRMRDAGAMARKILDIGASYVKVNEDF